MNFKNTKTAKVVSGFVGIATAVMMMGPAVASADAISDLTAQINALLAQVAALQAAQGGSVSTPVVAGGHTFSAPDITMGSKGSEVTELQMLLVAQGHLVMPVGVSYGYFGSLTKAALASWQAANGITPAVGYFGAISRAKANSMGGTTTTTTTTPGTTLPSGCTSAAGFSPITGVSCSTGTTAVSGTGVSVALDASSPMNQTLITPQGVATLAVFRISNGSSLPAKVTMMKFQRTGISSDATVNSVYLYQGSARLTDSASFSQGFVNFADAGGLVTVPAMSSVLVAVRGDIATGVNGQTLGVMLTDATADAGVVGGLPASGNSSSFATAPSGMATANFTATTSVGNIDPQNDVVVWQSNISIGNRDTQLTALRLQQIGSVNAADVVNFRLMIDGTQVSTAVAQADANRFVSFAFATPVTVKAGSHTMKVMADVVGGSGRNFKFSLRRVVDVEIWDSQLGVVVTPTVNSLTFVALEPVSASTINEGTLTVTKDTSSPSGSVVLNGSNVSLGKFVFRAQGEELKVESLTFGFTETTVTGAWGKVRSTTVYADGVALGSTQDMVPGGSIFNLGSSLILAPGKDVVVEVRGDIFDNDGTNTVAAGDTLLLNLLAGSANVYKRSSLNYTANGAMSGNTLTVAAGTMVMAKYTAYANQSVTVPQSAYKIGEFRLTAGSSEGVNLDTITLTLPNDGITDIVPADMTNLYVVYGTKTSTTKSAGAASQTFSVNEAIAANGTMNFAVYANLSAASNTGSTTVATLAVSGTSQSSGQAVAATGIAGQTITVAVGSLAVALDASTPTIANVVANSMPKVASFKYSSTNDAFTVNEIGVTAASSAAIVELVFKDGATELTRVAMNGTAATATGLSVNVPFNGTKIIDVYANLGGVGTGFATTSSNVAVSHSSTKYMDSNGQTLYDNTALNGNATYVFKTKPTITTVALPTTVLTNGVVTIAKFTISSDAAGTISWDKVSFSVATSSNSETATGFQLEDEAVAGVAVGSCALVTTTLTCSGANKQVSGSKTYLLKATMAGVVTNSSVSTSILGGDTYAAPNILATVTGNFKWSDESLNGHSTGTADWMNGYKVKNLPTDAQTISK